MKTPSAPKTTMIRPGLWETMDAANGNVWTIEERRDTWGGGNSWAWFASADNGDAMDPTPTKTRAAHIIAAITDF